eukprot:CCRYP_002403-RF/>CCRYP_002403-RF protein AED:0.04 eAED:0.04 QI:361/1/1/1/0.81/0.82/17/505/2306
MIISIIQLGNLTTTLLLLLLLLPPTSSQFTTLTCPSLGTPRIIPASTSSPTKIRIAVIRDDVTLCTLIRSNQDGTGRGPVARSYGSKWEASAGHFAKADSGLNIVCYSREGAIPVCDMTLPPLEEETQQYVLETRRRFLSKEAEAARFLEQATFGQTKEDIDALVATGNNFTSWVYDQMYNVSMSSHREFFRRRTNPKFEYPNEIGAVGSTPCEQYSRWRKYALTSRDSIQGRRMNWNKFLTIDKPEGIDGYVWKVDGHFRTITKDHPTFTNGSLVELGVRHRIPNPDGNAFKIDCIGCRVPIGNLSRYLPQNYISNPAVSIEGVEGRTNDLFPYRVVDLPPFKSSQFLSIENATAFHHLFAQWIHADENGLLNTTSLDGTDQCDGHPNFRQPLPVNERDSPPGTIPTVFGRSTDAATGEVHVFAFDPHLTLRENTLENPLEDGGGDLVMDTDSLVAGTQVRCQNAQMNFLNEKNCKLSYLKSACTPNTFPKKVIILDDANLASIREITGRNVYAVTGFSLTEVNNATGIPYFRPPCRPGRRTSRWIKNDADLECANSAGLGPMSLKTFRDIIDAIISDGSDQNYNPNIVDVTRNVLECDKQDVQKYDLGNVMANDGSCWMHSHPYEQSVFDLTGIDPNEYTVISDNVVSFSTSFLYESIVVGNRAIYPLLGKFGDYVVLDGTEDAPLDDSTVQILKSMHYNPAGRAVLICGSPLEVASDPLHGDQGFDVVVPEGSGYGTSSTWQVAAQRHTTWAHLALHAKDQLRQRVVWSLSQIIAVGVKSNGGSRVAVEKTEPYLVFYDMFVRNGFGSYRDLMREFSYNVLMAEWLSFIGNKSLQWNLMNGNGPNYPDENFAREIMQLFSIGLYKLNPDGSRVLSETGYPLEAYSMDDIFSYSRAWTGFVRSPLRGGVVATNKEVFETTSLDPMTIDPASRDLFPKTDLSNGYIGNRDVPLCVDLPRKHFLRRGAVFRLLGSVGRPTYQFDPADWSTNPDLKRIELDPLSPLFAKLCGRSEEGECTFPSIVKLDENLVYDEAAMSGQEYAVDTLRTVLLKSGSNPVFYEYIRQPCVELAFFDNAKKVIKGQVLQNYVQKPSMCGNPNLEIATPMCSETSWKERESAGKIYCHYQGERMSYASAEEYCLENGLEQSYPWIVLGLQGGPCGQGIIDQQFSSWSNAECSVLVKISFESGNIAIVHDPQPDYAGFKDVEPLVRDDTINFFKAYWSNQYPTEEDCLSLPSCYVHTDKKSCICTTGIHESSYFSTSDEIESESAVFSALCNGAVHPETFDAGVYRNIGNCGVSNLTVYATADEGCDNFTPDTIFSMELNGISYFLKNMKSVVYIPDSDFAFRNPSHFINMVDPAIRDMIYETESVIDSLFYHPNHPIFLSVRMIQRFGISNPSPGFVARVSEAYKDGSYQEMFGSRKYGDLAAMVAAILLDPESRTVVLDVDQAHGHLREPVIKVLAFFRSMGLSYASPLHIPTLLHLYDKLGEGSYETPSVFSFFLPEFSPSGVIQTADLVAPEAMVLQSHRVIGLIDAFFSTVKIGISNCYPYTFDGSSGDDRGGNQNWALRICATKEGDTSLSSAKTTYWPSSTSSASDIIDELSILLTAGRLTDDSKALIKAYVGEEIKNGDIAKAIRIAQQLILSAPEYHVTNIVRKQSNVRETLGYTNEPESSYKVVVVLMMIGGLDSFNLLLPKGRCMAADQYKAYTDARGTQHAIPLERLESIYANNQTCMEYGVNADFDILADLYNDKEALFFANTGVLSKPMTRDSWSTETSFQPFAHNIMQEEFYAGDPYNSQPGTGVFGRILDLLKANNGHQTAAYAVNGGEEMLTGSPLYGNSVQSLSTTVPQSLNRMPTLRNMYDIAKQLNGIGDAENSFFGETWSSKFASALFDHTQAEEVASIPEFNIPDDEFPVSFISSSLKTVAENIRSRGFRKVDREVYVVPDFGYDLHFGNTLSELLRPVNDALKPFVEELKSQGIWDDTVIVMGSDFGRSLTANSNGGTDHAWGGNYFIAGGNVQGGQILGDYPDFNVDNPSWIDRGRFVPTTPWDAVWNGIANWFGVRDDAGLDWAIPNRRSFDKCELFYDSDLFKDGTCKCDVGCPDAEIGYRSSRRARLPNYTWNVPDEKGELVATVLSKDSTISTFGCHDPNDRETTRAIDKTTKKFFCERISLYQPSGIIITPSTQKMSIVKGMRIYSQNNCPKCDVVSFVLEGRKDPTSSWAVVSDGDLPHFYDPLPRNLWGEVIDSTYESGDANLEFAEVKLTSNNAAYLDYKLTFSKIRDPNSKFIQLAELELPGLVLDS